MENCDFVNRQLNDVPSGLVKRIISFMKWVTKWYTIRFTKLNGKPFIKCHLYPFTKSILYL